MASSSRERATEFCRRFGLDAPILLAPMAGACPPSLAVAVANAGGMGAAPAGARRQSAMRSDPRLECNAFMNRTVSPDFAPGLT